MKNLFRPLLLGIALTATTAVMAAQESDTFQTPGGKTVVIHHIKHASIHFEFEGMHIYGPGPSPVISFNLAAHGDVSSFIHHLDLCTLLDRLGIAVRTGHHCAEPLMHRLGIEGTVRASLALYNTKDDIDALVKGINRVRQMF